MDEDKSEGSENVTISVNIEGEYSEVVPKLQSEGDRENLLVDFIDDTETLLATVERIDGGTRSAIAQSLPEDASMAGDPDAVVDMLQVLERYDLVTLEGNTWMPEAQLSEN